MTYELRTALDYRFGTLSTAAAISDTTLQAADFANLPGGTSVSTTQYIPITLQDPTTKLFEVVWVNAHTVSSTTVTVLRGQEGTTARSWASGTLWTLGSTVRDFLPAVANRAALPASPHIGGRALLLDEQRVLTRYSAGWLEPRLVIPGGVLRATDDADTSGTVEKAVVTSGTFSLEASSIYLVTLEVYYRAHTSGDKFDVSLRETSSSGTLLQTDNGPATTAAEVNQFAVVHHPVVTTTAVNKVYVGTLLRNAGTGTAFAKIGSHIIVERLGHTSLLTAV